MAQAGEMIAQLLRQLVGLKPRTGCGHCTLKTKRHKRNTKRKLPRGIARLRYKPSRNGPDFAEGVCERA